MHHFVSLAQQTFKPCGLEQLPCDEHHRGCAEQATTWGYTPKNKHTSREIQCAATKLLIYSYSCRAMLNFEPVAPQATGGISQINKSSLLVHMWSCTCVRWLKWIANTSTICYMITYSFINKHFNCAHMILKETKLWNYK